MREMFVGARDEQGENGENLNFGYYILIGEMPVSEGFACEAYGVKILETGHPDEAVSIPNITISAGRIDELMELLIRNSVAPAGLSDTVADWL
ncbi:conserved hypothetical protein [uncultured Eubacteriales bacterium]|uniref:Uncharacterized protein n=1 Tax=uncultured Eubacteriales bacterium TaxID=172733 RepID=A0A212J6S7_9FIRM|nr:conserved hypothetical protein [uncultured Eubacteriales bacterium]